MGSRRYFNGAKTLGLFVALWVVMLGLGAVIGDGQYIWLFAGLSVVGTAIGYWNSATLAIRPCTRVPSPRCSSPPCTGSCAS